MSEQSYAQYHFLKVYSMDYYDMILKIFLE